MTTPLPLTAVNIRKNKKAHFTHTKVLTVHIFVCYYIFNDRKGDINDIQRGIKQVNQGQQEVTRKFGRTDWAKEPYVYQQHGC